MCSVTKRATKIVSCPLHSIISISPGVCSALLNCYDSAHIRLWAVFASQELSESFAEVMCSIIETAVWRRGRFSSLGNGNNQSVSVPWLLRRWQVLHYLLQMMKFHHLQSNSERIRHKWATKILYRHVSLLLSLSHSLSVFVSFSVSLPVLFSPQPYDQLASTANAFVHCASHSTQIVNETLCLWAS